MIVFNNIDEMQQYYNENTNTFEFYDNGEPLDIKLNFNLRIYANLTARDIKSHNIRFCDITARNIDAYNIMADTINAHDIESYDIDANIINANNINAYNIAANTIDAWDINFYAVCYAYKRFVCNSINGERENSKYFCLDSSVIIKNK